MKVTTKWTKGYASTTTNNRGHNVILDLPVSKEGSDTGASALELCLMSYSGCVHTIFNVVAQKMRISFDYLDVNMSGEQKNDALTFTDVEIHLSIDTQASDVKIKKCLDQTLKTCPVGILFKQSGVNTSYKIEKLNDA
ncbi:OsmC family protein [Marinifilum sp. RC60d5]|uniref:OsmC family protein n=1 Tax=Marinifilum sp. RC60d5 TaxID=3458414 RepID=UPI004035C972